MKGHVKEVEMNPMTVTEIGIQSPSLADRAITVSSTDILTEGFVTLTNLQALRISDHSIIPASYSKDIRFHFQFRDRHS
jgi:hypothetical protein